MAKWKCEICNSEFDNFQAQGFNHKIYCPLCYFKKLNNDKDKEIERLNKIIIQLENSIKSNINALKDAEYDYEKSYKLALENTLEYLKKLKEEGKE